ncbi:MAG: hypothetical protein IKG42_04875 [Clostridia bacterium]|nr:hypothetical protein [Clostridia bacterium]
MKNKKVYKINYKECMKRNCDFCRKRAECFKEEYIKNEKFKEKIII